MIFGLLALIGVFATALVVQTVRLSRTPPWNTETALQVAESEFHFRVLAENIPGVIYLCRNDPRYTMLYLNDAVLELTGYPRQDFLKDRISFVDLYDPEYAPGIHTRVEEALRQRRPFSLVYRLRHRSGEWRWVEEVGVGIFEGDELIYLEGYLTDITERQRAEDAAREAQMELLAQKDREAERLSDELAHVQEKWTRSIRLATIGEVSAQVAHDIRNPLASIKNAAFFVRRKLPAEEELAHVNLDIIDQEVAICDQIITNMLDATRLKPPRREHLDLGPLIREAASRLTEETGVEVAFTVELPYCVYADPVQLRRVFDNLLKNAADASPSNGRIEVTAQRASGMDVICVHDEGPGVSPDQAEAIFDLFYTTKAKGTGLGLGICRQIVEHHGGTLSVVSNGRAGATFEIRLPVFADGSAPSELQDDS